MYCIYVQVVWRESSQDFETAMKILYFGLPYQLWYSHSCFPKLEDLQFVQCPRCYFF